MSMQGRSNPREYNLFNFGYQNAVSSCASRIPNSLAEFGIEATLRGVWPPAPMPATGATRGNLRGFWGRGGRFGRGGGIARRGPAVGLTSGGVGPGDRRESRDNWPIMARYTAIERAPAAVDSRPIRRSAPVHLEFVGRPPRGAGSSPGSGRPNGHCSARHGPPCVRQRRSPACGPSTTRGCVHRWRRPDATQRCLDPGLSERIGNSRRTGGVGRPHPSRMNEVARTRAVRSASAVRF